MLSFLFSDFALEQASYVIFVSIVVIRIRLGYFPTYTNWSAVTGLIGLLLLWLRRTQTAQDVVMDFDADRS